MYKRILRGTRDLWLPALILVLGALLSLAGWGLLIVERRSATLEASRESAQETGGAIVGHLERQAEVLEGLGALWARFGRFPLAQWRSSAELLVETAKGLESVAWIDLERPSRSLALGGERSAEQGRSDEREVRLHRDEPFVVGPEVDAEGAAWYRVLLPIRSAGAASGAEAEAVLVARIDVEKLLTPLLRARARGYALSVVWDGREIFSRGAPSTDPWQSWWRVEESIALPFDGAWRLVHRPTPELATSRLTPIPHYLLAAGVLVSLLLAFLAHQWRLTARQSRFLSASNRALEQSSHDLRGLNLELEGRVAERTEELEDAVRELEAFNYSVSHDLRSPLGAILNFSAILEEDYRERPLDDAGIAVIARIRRSALRATALLEDLLDLSRAGREQLELETIDMETLAREIFAQVRAAHDDADVELVIGPLPTAMGDRGLLGGVFSNLFGNALKYSRGRDKRRVRVGGRLEGRECIFEVADNGRGFDMRFAPKLFELFERLHDDDGIEGTGVGLALVARIVKRHGGRVWAEGEVDVGARFFFSIPRAGEQST